MRCPHCEFERPEAFAFCPMCGKSSTRAEDATAICPTPNILSFIKDDLFLTVCILLTVGVGSSLLYGGLNIIFTLITIFAWLTYASGRKNVIEHRHIRVISGSVYAAYIINNIIATLAAVFGVFYIIALSIPALLGDFNLEELLSNNLPAEEYGALTLIPFTMAALLTVLAVVIGFILIIFAIILLIINVAGLRKIHRFIKSIYQSAQNGEENIIYTNKVSGWLIAFAIITTLSAITLLSSGNVFAFITEGSFASVYIILNILIRKHLINKKQPF